MSQATVWKPQTELESNPNALGRDAVTVVAPQPDQHVASLLTLLEVSYIEHEPESVLRFRDMLERDRDAEVTIAQKLRGSIEQCAKLGDYGSETLLKQILLKVEDRAHHLDHYLGDDSLGLGSDG